LERVDARSNCNPVRSLEREIGKTLRDVAVRIAEGSASAVRLTSKDIGAVLGQARFWSEVAMRTSVAGAATGLAWTLVGGDILFIEAARTPGKGSHPDRTAGRRHAGERPSRIDPREDPVAGAPRWPRRARRKRHPHPRARRRDAKGRTERRGRDVHSSRVSRHRSEFPKRHGHDREISLRGLVLPVGRIKAKVVAAAGLTRVM
jgi:ATP-dependent Lon protease